MTRMRRTRTMSEHANETAFEYVMEVGALEGARFYLERLAFTRRGNFAFVVAMLYMIYDHVSYAVTTGTPSANAPIYMAQTGFLANMAAAFSGLLTVLTGLLAAFLVLFVLDVYESEVGLSIDADH